MNRRIVLIVTFVIAGLLIVSGVALAKMNKFTFEGVTLVDGDQVVENGVIEVASKLTQKNKNADPTELTTCSYYTEDYQTYLGQFQGEAFFARDEEDAARDFCVNNYPDRVE